VPSSDGLTGERADLVAAARAAAGWARARRAAWTDAPLAVVTTAPEDRRLPVPAARPHRVSGRAGPSVVARAAQRARLAGAAVVPWLPRVAAGAALVAVAVVGGPYLWNAAATAWTAATAVRPTPVAVVPPPKAPTPSPAPASRKGKATGGVHVISTPVGAQVLVDGKARGVTPLTLTDLIVGRHTIELKSEAGDVQRTVNVAANATTEIDESIFSGWLAVISPFDLAISEGGRALRLDERNQVMLPPGRHTVRLLNRALAYEAERDVELKPGETTTLTVKPPPSTITVTATETVEVWLDGVRIGETPVDARPIELGAHDVLVRRAGGGDRRFPVTITVSPFTLNVDFTKPG
jgi:PEGA domain-containing protein